MPHRLPEDMPRDAAVPPPEDPVDRVALDIVFTGSVRGALAKVNLDLAWLEEHQELVVKRVRELGAAAQRVQDAVPAGVLEDLVMAGRTPAEGIATAFVELLRRGGDAQAGGGGGPLLDLLKGLEGKRDADGRVRLPPSDPVPVTGGGVRDDTGRINRVG